MIEKREYSVAMAKNSTGRFMEKDSSKANQTNFPINENSSR